MPFKGFPKTSIESSCIDNHYTKALIFKLVQGKREDWPKTHKGNEVNNPFSRSLIFTRENTQ